MCGRISSVSAIFLSFPFSHSACHTDSNRLLWSFHKDYVWGISTQTLQFGLSLRANARNDNSSYVM